MDKNTAERRDKAQLHNLPSWNEKTIAFIDKHVRKGDYRFVQTKLEHTSTGKDGETTYFTNIVIKTSTSPSRRTPRAPATRTERAGPPGNRRRFFVHKMTI